MAERRKTKIKKKDKKSQDDMKPSKEELAVAKYLRFNCPTKQSTIMGNDVYYFTASKAVDCILSSKWSKKQGKQEALFTSREGCVHYLNGLLQKEMFYRARRLVQRPRDKEKDAAGGTPAVTTGSAAAASQPPPQAKGTPKPKRDDKETKEKKETTKEKKDDKSAATKESKDTTTADDKEEKEAEDKKKEKKKKVKLEYHPDQVFVDGNDTYVWIFDPTSLKTWLFGSLIVIGSIGICLFPLWPAEVRQGVYYLSMSAMGFVGLILLLVIIRSLMFGAVWAITFGRHHFWFLPNLTEDCGFFDSFKPLYSHKYCPSSGSEKKDDDASAKDGSEKEATNEDKKQESDGGKDDQDQNTDTDRDSDSNRTLNTATKTADDENLDATGTGTTIEEKRSPSLRKRRNISGRNREAGSSSSQESNSGFEIVDPPAASKA